MEELAAQIALHSSSPVVPRSLAPFYLRLRLAVQQRRTARSTDPVHSKSAHERRGRRRGERLCVRVLHFTRGEGCAPARTSSLAPQLVPLATRRRSLTRRSPLDLVLPAPDSPSPRLPSPRTFPSARSELLAVRDRLTIGVELRLERDLAALDDRHLLLGLVARALGHVLDLMASGRAGAGGRGEGEGEGERSRGRATARRGGVGRKVRGGRREGKWSEG